MLDQDKLPKEKEVAPFSRRTTPGMATVVARILARRAGERKAERWFLREERKVSAEVDVGKVRRRRQKP